LHLVGFYYKNNSVERSHWEANSLPASQKIQNIL